MAPRTLWIAGLTLLACTVPALAHGGAYQPPPPPPVPGPAVPPGAIPAGPTTGGGETGSPITGGGESGTPTTGDGDVGGGSGPTKGPETGSGTSPAPTPTTGGGAGSGFPATGGAAPTRPTPRHGGASTALSHWTRWWYPNRRHIIEWSARALDRQQVDTTPGGDATAADSGMWRAEVQAALHDALRSSNEDLASGAAIALGKLGDVSDAPVLARLLNDASRQAPVREAAAVALGLLPPGSLLSGGASGGALDTDDTRRALEHVVRDRGESLRLRATAAYALGLRAELGSLPLLMEAAHSASPTWDLPAAGIAALGLAGFDIVQPDLIRLLAGPRRDKQRESIRRAYAAQALSAIRTPASLVALRGAITDSDEDVRRAAVLGLGALATADDDKTMDALVRVLYRDKDDACRHMAAISIGRIGHARGEAALRYGYLKGDRSLQPFSAIALGLYARHPGHQSASDLLVTELEQRANADLRGALAIAVGLSQNVAGAEILREIAMDRGDPSLRGHAAFAIGLLDDRAAGAPVLRDMLTDIHAPEVQREVALGLGMLGDREAVRLLIDLAVDGGSVYVQGSAAMALGRIGGEQAGVALLGVLRDESRPGLARAMAGVGLGLVLDKSEGKRLARVGADLNWYLFTPTVHELLTIL